jgi:CRISPR/Cas system Type II protein with McrA/HNH and RuvC-like nuclease domain
MELFRCSRDYLYNLHATSSSEAKRIWRKTIREQWNHKCAYCDSEENLSLDHIIPQSKGGSDSTDNVICCCKPCNHSKGHSHWEEWYYSQDFFNHERHSKIKNWMEKNSPSKSESLYRYKPRKNNLT